MITKRQAENKVSVCAAEQQMPESAFDRKLNWILDKLKAAKAEQEHADQPGTSSLAQSRTFSDLAGFLEIQKYKCPLVVLLFCAGLTFCGALLRVSIVESALGLAKFEGQQILPALVILAPLQAVAYISAMVSPLGIWGILYGPFLAKIAGPCLPARLQLWNPRAKGCLAASLWALAWMAAATLATAEACVIARSVSWPSPCQEFFCNDLQLQDLSTVAASVFASAAFYTHCLSWWYACVIPLPAPPVCSRWPVSVRLLSAAFSMGLPLVVGFCFLYISQPENTLEHFLFTAGCLVSVGVAGHCVRVCAKISPKLQAWQLLLGSLTLFAAFGVAVSVVRIMSANQEMPQANPPGMFAMCVLDNIGACGATSQSTVRTAQHARFLLLATTAFPACCGLAWKALRPDFTREVRGERDWISKLLVSALAVGAVSSLWGFSTFREESERLAAEILFFLLIGLASCFFLRQLHWRAYFWVKFQRDPATAKNPYEKFVIAEFDSAPRLRKHRVSHPALVTGNRAKVLHLRRPLRGWPSFWDIGSRMEAVAMSLQCTIAPFYHMSSWRQSMSELSKKSNNVPFLSHGEVVFLASVALAFLIGKVCLLLFVMLAPIHFNDVYLQYNATQDIVEDMYDHALSAGGHKNVFAENYIFGFVRIVSLWWLGNSELYRQLFIAVAAACSALAACWRWKGLFSFPDSCLHALALFVVMDAEIRKVIILRDAELATQCWLVGAVPSWFQRTLAFFVAYAGPAFVQTGNVARACWQMRGHVVLYDLLTKYLIPSSANVLVVSAANLPYSIQQNDCILDYQIFQFVAASATTIATLLAAPGAATMSDVVSFIAQALLKLKGPLDAYALRLKRIGSIAKALSESSPVDYEPMAFDDLETCPQMRYFSDVPTWCCGKVRFYEVMSSANVAFFPRSPATSQRSKKRLTSATLGVGEEVHIEIGQEKVWATSRLLRRRLAVSVQFTEPDLWAFWTLEVNGLRTGYRRVLGCKACVGEPCMGTARLMWCILG